MSPGSCIFNAQMNTRQVRHIIWDWNGTLLDDTAACVESINLMLGRRRLPPVDVRRYRDHFVFPAKDYYVTLGFDFVKEDWDAVAREFHKFYRVASANSPLREGTVEMLTRMKQSDMPMSILSACESSLLDQMLRARGIRDVFVHVRGLSDLYAASKLAIGRILMPELNLSPCTGAADRRYAP